MRRRGGCRRFIPNEWSAAFQCNLATSRMWARNCLFVVVCLAGAGLIANTLLKRERVSPPHVHASGDLDASLASLNAEFRRSWEDKQLQPAPRADDLTIARRLSL